MTPKQQVRAECLERLACVDLVEMKQAATDLGLPARFLKNLNELTVYLEKEMTRVEPHKSLTFSEKALGRIASAVME